MADPSRGHLLIAEDCSTIKIIPVLNSSGIVDDDDDDSWYQVLFSDLSRLGPIGKTVNAL